MNRKNNSTLWWTYVLTDQNGRTILVEVSLWPFALYCFQIRPIFLEKRMVYVFSLCSIGKSILTQWIWISESSSWVGNSLLPMLSYPGCHMSDILWLDWNSCTWPSLDVDINVSKGAKTRNQYNQVPHLTQDTNRKVTNSQLYTTNKSQEVSPSPAGDHRSQINRCTQRHIKHKTEKT